MGLGFRVSVGIVFLILLQCYSSGITSRGEAFSELGQCFELKPRWVPPSVCIAGTPALQPQCTLGAIGTA